MTQLNIEVTDELKREMKATAALSGKSLQSWAAEILSRHLAEVRASRDALRIADLEAEIAKLKAQHKKL
jgi:plasmid stability protein